MFFTLLLLLGGDPSDAKKRWYMFYSVYGVIEMVSFVDSRSVEALKAAKNYPWGYHLSHVSLWLSGMSCQLTKRPLFLDGHCCLLHPPIRAVRPSSCFSSNPDNVIGHWSSRTIERRECCIITWIFFCNNPSQAHMEKVNVWAENSRKRVCHATHLNNHEIYDVPWHASVTEKKKPRSKWNRTNVDFSG